MAGPFPSSPWCEGAASSHPRAVFSLSLAASLSFNTSCDNPAALLSLPLSQKMKMGCLTQTP